MIRRKSNFYSEIASHKRHTTFVFERNDRALSLSVIREITETAMWYRWLAFCSEFCVDLTTEVSQKLVFIAFGSSLTEGQVKHLSTNTRIKITVPYSILSRIRLKTKKGL